MDLARKSETSDSIPETPEDTQPSLILPTEAQFEFLTFRLKIINWVTLIVEMHCSTCKKIDQYLIYNIKYFYSKFISVIIEIYKVFTS